jgi:hypothetical protein
MQLPEMKQSECVPAVPLLEGRPAALVPPALVPPCEKLPFFAGPEPSLPQAASMHNAKISSRPLTTMLK